MSWDGYWKNEESRVQSEKMRTVHPIWRGIGFLMMILIPLFSFAVADELVKWAPGNVSGFSMPPEFQGFQNVPLYGPVHNFYGVLALTFVLSILMFAVFGVINALIFSIMGGSPSDVLNAPPEKVKKKKRS